MISEICLACPETDCATKKIPMGCAEAKSQNRGVNFPAALPGYEPLAQVLQEALDQAQGGKGHERHANGLPFTQQPILAESRMIGPGGLVFQARKKILEASTGIKIRRQAALADLLGAINYTAALILYYREAEAVSPAPPSEASAQDKVSPAPAGCERVLSRESPLAGQGAPISDSI